MVVVFFQHITIENRLYEYNRIMTDTLEIVKELQLIENKHFTDLWNCKTMATDQGVINGYK